MSKTHKLHGKKGYIADQRLFFDDLITQDWATYTNPLWDRTRQIEVHNIMRHIPPPRRVLDVGCGAGYHDLIFSGYAEVQQIIGIDYSAKSIEQANKHYPNPKVQREVADIFQTEELVVRLGQFDLVTSFQVIEHLAQAQEFLQACRTLTAQGGHIAIVTPNGARLENRLLRFLRQPARRVDPLHYLEYSVAELTQMGAEISLDQVGLFGHTLHLSFPVLNLLNRLLLNYPQWGRYFPQFASVIGVIFHNKNFSNMNTLKPV